MQVTARRPMKVERVQQQVIHELQVCLNNANLMSNRLLICFHFQWNGSRSFTADEIKLAADMAADNEFHISSAIQSFSSCSVLTLFLAFGINMRSFWPSEFDEVVAFGSNTETFFNNLVYQIKTANNRRVRHTNNDWSIVQCACPQSPEEGQNSSLTLDSVRFSELKESFFPAHRLIVVVVACSLVPIP
jgi:hypothetical protein